MGKKLYRGDIFVISFEDLLSAECLLLQLLSVFSSGGISRIASLQGRDSLDLGEAGQCRDTLGVQFIGSSVSLD